jgi:uncharacterized integral membrane protein (TIGR00698 family)
VSFSKENRSHTLSGILFVTLFALSSAYLAEIHWIEKAGLSALVIAIVLGIIYGNTLHHRLPVEWAPGVAFSAKKLLRLAIVLYGFRVSFQEIASIGLQGLLLDIFVVAATLIVGTWIGTKLFKLDRHIALLVSAGSAICGAAAVLALESVLKSEAHKTAVAVGTVVLFGTTAMFLYPWFQHEGWWGLTQQQYGLFAGASIHEVAQVVTAGNAVSPQAGEIAVIVKMTRVLLLVPVLIGLSLYEKKTAIIPHHSHAQPLTIPWFAILFAVVIGFNSLHLLPPSVITLINQFDTFLLTMAMAAIGMETHLGKIKKVGLKPLYLAVILFLWLMGSVWLLIKFL